MPDDSPASKTKSTPKTESTSQRLSRLKGRKLEAARCLLDQDIKTGKPLPIIFEDTEEVEKIYKPLMEMLAEMESWPPKKRQEVLNAVYGNLGREAELVWQQVTTQPLPHSPFRWPGNEAAYRHHRRWMMPFYHKISVQCREGLEDMLAKSAGNIADTYVGLVGLTFAAVIDEGGEQGELVLRTLIDRVMGNSDPGEFNHHALTGLMACGREEAWKAIEKLLLAAGRQEGLRQSILSQIHTMHPEAFRRLLRLMLDENLLRFSSAARSVDLWFRLEWDARSVKEFQRIVTLVLTMMEDGQACRAALTGDDAETAYFALWTLAYRDIGQALPEAEKLLSHPEPLHRFAAGYLLSQIEVDESHVLASCLLEDENLQVASWAFRAFHLRYPSTYKPRVPENYHRLVKLIGRLPKKAATKEPEGLIWPWVTGKAEVSEVADQLPRHAIALGLPVADLLPYMSMMSTRGRELMVQVLDPAIADPKCREALFALAGDRSSQVAESVFETIKKHELKPGECEGLEAGLKRTSSTYRRGAIELLLRQPAKDALVSAERLLKAKSKPQRLAGLELIGQLSAKHAKDEETLKRCRKLAGAYRQKHSELTKDESVLLESFAQTEEEVLTLHNCVGLIDPAKLTLPRPMEDKGLPLITEAAARLAQSLDKFITAHKEEPIDHKDVHGYGGKNACLLGEVVWGWPETQAKKSREENLANFPLAELWMEWWKQRPKEARDADGAECLRAWIGCDVFSMDGPWFGWKSGTLPDVKYKLTGGKLKNDSMVRDILEWILFLEHDLTKMSRLALDTWETSCARYAEYHLGPKGLTNHTQLLNDGDGPQFGWMYATDKIRNMIAGNWPEEMEKQFTDISLWMWRPTLKSDSGEVVRSPIEFSRPEHELMACARQNEWITRDDAIFYLIGREEGMKYGHDYEDKTWFRYHADRFETALDDCTRRNATTRKLMERCPRYRQDAVETCERVTDIELQRGDLPTVVSPIANCINDVTGARRFVQFATVLESEGLQRSESWRSDNLSRKAVFSRLVRNCYPAEDEKPETFSKLLKEAKLKDGILVELAVYVPRWAAFIEKHLGWDGLQDAVLWYQAHTKDYQHEHGFLAILRGEDCEWETDDKLWLRDITERTDLAPQDLTDGAVDVKWFFECQQKLGPKRWKQVHGAAKYATSGAGHTRAKIFADAMLGNLTKADVVKRIKEKRHQDTVRALGLLPLAKGKQAEADILDRYEVLQEFLRGSKKFGSQRQASEKRAVEIGMANLARTAGYADPIRLEWAMEAKAVADLADGAVAVTRDDVSVALHINPWSEPEITVIRGEKELKAVPAKLKKDAEIKALTARKTALKRQLSRMRLSLETMMCRGDGVSGAELRTMFANPLLQHMLTQLLFISTDGELIGYPDNGGKTLTSHDGKTEAVGTRDELRLAHPLDLLERGDWSAWQRECFAHERIQPFKQVFRELYPMTASEHKGKKTETDRYAGHQVQPRQALALLGSRGWVIVPEEGIRKTFHHANLNVWLGFDQPFYTAAEVEDPTLETVCFTRRMDGKPVALKDVDPRLFSEVMRDMDLVVSVAHAGGVDPEASQSTVEMRTALVKQTARLLHLDNVTFKGNSVLIDGVLGKYSLHLGSAVTHQLPGGALFIVPVRSQHRGRIFLPFADSDPRTAELMSKLILLARDGEIKDPSILAQIRKD